MTLEKHINSYLGGMNKDLSTSQIGSDVYIDGNNIRIVSGGDGGYDGGNSVPQNDTGTVTNIKGNSAVCSFNGKYLSHTFLRDSLILMTHSKGVVTDIDIDTPYIDHTITAPSHGLNVSDTIGFLNTAKFNSFFWNVDSVTDSDTIVVSPLTQNDTCNITDYSGTIPGTIRITTTSAHGITNYRNKIVLVGTTNYDGLRTCFRIDATSFWTRITYSANRSGTIHIGWPFQPKETSLTDAYWYKPRQFTATYAEKIAGPSYTYMVYNHKHKIPEGTRVFIKDLDDVPDGYYSTQASSSDPDDAFNVVSGVNDATPSPTPTVIIPEAGDDKIYKIALEMFRKEHIRSISGVVDYSSTVAGTINITTTTAHTLSTGDIVRLVDTTDYDDEYQVTVIDSTHFYVTATYTETRTGSAYFYQNFTLTDVYYFHSSSPDVYMLSGSLYYDGLVYKGDLGVNPEDPIRMFANYETNTIQKVYWISKQLRLYHLNTVYNANTNNLTALNLELLKMVPSLDHQSIDIELQAGGHLSCGRKQWAYQLYKINGAETTMSPSSVMINVGPVSDDISSAELFKGGELGEIAIKSAKVTIDTGDSGEIFDRIKLVCIEYLSLDLPPTVRIVTEQSLLDPVVTIYDYGDSIGEITLEEFQFIQYDLSAATFTSKNNYLITANTTDEFFDVEKLYIDTVNEDTSGIDYLPFLDTRVYRWRTYIDGGAGSTEVMYGKEENTKSNLNVKDATKGRSIISFSGGIEENDAVEFENPDTAIADWKIIVPIVVIDSPSGPPAGYSFSEMITSSVVQLQNELYININTGADTVGLPLVSQDPVTGERITATVTYDAANLEFTITGPKGIGYLEGYIPNTNYKELSTAVATATVNEFKYRYSYTYDESVGAGASVSECVINRGSSGEQVITTDTFDDIIDTDNAINTFNDVSNDEEYKDTFIYQSDGTTIGGTGPLVDYRLIDDYDPVWVGSFGTRTSDAHTIATSPNPWTYNIYMNYLRSAEDAVYMPDEVYRFSLVFYDLQMRPSFAQWIGDIRMPNMREFNPFSNYLKYNIPKIRFRINTDLLPDGFWNNIKGYQFVRSPRRAADKSVIANGIISMAIEDSGNDNYSPIYLTSAADWGAPGTPGTIRTISNWNVPVGHTHSITGADPWYSVVEFISADGAFNKEFAIQTGDYLEATGQLVINSEVTSAYTVAPYNRRYYSLTSGRITTANYTDLTDATNRGRLWASIQEGFFSGSEQKDPISHTINSKIYYARGTDGGTNPSQTYKGSSAVMDVERFTSTTIPSGASAGEAIVANYKRNLGLGMYGGSTYSQRSLSAYIPCSKFIDKGTKGGYDTNYVRGGDVYYSYFAFLKSLHDPTYENSATLDSGQSLITFPTISEINVDWRLDQLLNWVTFGESTTPSDYHLNEVANWGISDYSITYPTNFNLYRYNSVYSTDDVSRQFIPKPFDFNSVVSYDTRIRYSDQKIAGEYVDSWLKFRTGNYLDMDGNYGEVIRLLSLHNDLYAFQPFAVSKVSVLDREVLPSNTSQSLTIGSGGVLERYDYITTNSGTDFYDAVIPTERGLYYYDNYTRDIKRIAAEGVQSLSEIKGMKTFFNERKLSNVVGAYDKENRELLFSLHHNDTNKYDDITIVYSLFTDSFAPFQNFVTDKFISKGDIVMALNSSNDAVYRHNIGKYGEFFDTTYDSTISLIVNPLKMRTSSFHTIEFLTNLYNGKVHLPNTTIDSIDLSTSTQTGTQLTTFKQRFRTWRNNILRDTSNNRLRDNYLRLDVTLTDNSNNYKYILHPFITQYSPTKVR